MPFMKGLEPVRRSIKYLDSGRLVLKDKIKVLTVNYNSFGEHHMGARDFVFWFLPQIQYKNPTVQVATFRNLTPTPFIKCYWEDGKKMIIDIDDKPKEEVLEHLIKVVGKNMSQLAEEALQKEKKDNPANFGAGCERACICEIKGQIPCPGVLQFPKCMRGKYIKPTN